MTEFAAFNATSHATVLLEADYNNILDHAFEKTAAYIIRKNGSYYEAIKGGTSTSAGTIAYGGSGNAGATSGTDCEAVIEAAITAADGGHIHIAGADYSIADEVDVGKANTWITGDGLDTKITQATADKHGFKITTKGSVRISNLYLYGTGADTGCGIYTTTTCTDLAVDRVRCENWGYHGIYVDNSNYIKVLYCLLVSNIRNGLNLDTVDYSLIKGCKINTNTRHGIWMDDSSYNIVSNNFIVGNDSANAATYDGVNINHSGGTSDYNQIVNNTISDNDNYEINISTASCTGTIIRGNNTYGTDRTGVLSDSGSTTVRPTLMKSGQYTGDGSLDLGVTGVGFTPIYVKVWADNLSHSANFIWKSDQDTGTTSHYSSTGGVDSDKLISLDSDGFSVDDDGVDAHPNKNGQTYNYFAYGHGF